MKTVVITQYPLGYDEVRARLPENVGSIEHFPVANLSGGSYVGRVLSLKSIKADQAFVFLRDEESIPFLPILTIVSYCMGANKRYILYPDNAIRSIGVLALVHACTMLLIGLFIGLWSIIYCWLHLLYLRSKKKVSIRLSRDELIKNKFPSLTYLHASPWSGIQAGGSVTHTYEIIKAFVDSGVDVNLLSNSPEAIKISKVNKIKIPAMTTYVLPREINHFKYTNTFYRHVLKTFKRTDTVIYQRSSQGQFAGVKLSRKWRLPLVIEYNGPENWMASNWGSKLFFPGLVRLVEDINLLHAHVIVVISNELKSELISRGIEEEKIVCQPNGVDVNFFDPDRFQAEEIAELRASLGFDAEDTVVTFLGTFGVWHGADVFADAILKLKTYRGTDASKPAKLKFLMIGDGAQLNTVKATLKNESDTGDIVFTGLLNRSLVPLHLRASDICVVPTRINQDNSEFFGSPTKLFEYLAMGVPIVASNLSQTKEIMQGSPNCSELASGQLDNFSGSVGVLVEPNNSDDLALAIELLARDPNVRSKMGANGRALTLAGMTWAHRLEQIKAFVMSMLLREVKPVRVLINAIHSKSGGGVTYLRNILPYLVREPSLDIHLCLHGNQKHLFLESESNLTTHYVDNMPGLFKLILFEQFRLPILSKSWGIDVIFSPANYGPLYPQNTVLLLRNALSVAFVEKRPKKFLYWLLLYMATLSSLIRANSFIAVSKYASMFAEISLPKSIMKRCTIIHHGIDERFRNAKWQIGGDFLLVVSDLYVQKNLHRLFEALVHVKKRVPNIKLKIAGSAIDSDYAERLYLLVRELGLDSNVEFVGSVTPDKLVEYYTTCALFVFPSTVETFGNSLVEAMACGAPVACSNTAAMPEIAGDAVIYFPPNEPKVMAEVIADLLENSNKREKLSQKALERAKAFSWEATAQLTKNVLVKASLGRL